MRQAAIRKVEVMMDLATPGWAAIGGTAIRSEPRVAERGGREVRPAVVDRSERIMT
jgi:hypothetical protein